LIPLYLGGVVHHAHSGDIEKLDTGGFCPRVQACGRSLYPHRKCQLVVGGHH